MTNRTPARALPLLYLGAGHVSLATACLMAAWWPRATAGFFYHSWMVAIVHLVTLGWITFSILGTFYIVGPLVLRMEMPARRLDYLAYAFALVGLVGMVGHFWIQEYGGMAWSAGTVVCGVLYMAARIAARVRHAALPSAIKLHLWLACLNIWIAASTGLLIAIDKIAHMLPGYVLSNVFAHAHLATIGWATMMVVGVGYRILPMTFPSKMPDGRSLYASAILLETGVIGLFVALLIGSGWSIAFGFLIVAGLAVFLNDVVWMLRRRMRKPAGAPRLDFSLLHTIGAGVCLAAAAAIGLMLLVLPATPWTLHLAAAYGFLGLVGFLAQMVVAMEARLLPLATWVWTYADSGFREAPPPPYAMRDRMLQAIVFATWSAGVPTLAAGLYRESAWLVASGAWSLFAGVAVMTLDTIYVVARAICRTRPTIVTVHAASAT